MGRLRHRSCKVCGARYPYVSISARGLCPDHTRMRIADNLTQLVEGHGPYFDYWRQRTLAAFGVGIFGRDEEEREDAA